MELWFVDAEALVWRDGELILRHAFDLPLGTRPAGGHRPVERPAAADRRGRRRRGGARRAAGPGPLLHQPARTQRQPRAAGGDLPRLPGRGANHPTAAPARRPLLRAGRQRPHQQRRAVLGFGRALARGQMPTPKAPTPTRTPVSAAGCRTTSTSCPDACWSAGPFSSTGPPRFPSPATASRSCRTSATCAGFI